jgi:phosphoserine phosphatase
MSVLCLIANPQEPMFDVGLAATIQREVGGDLNWLNHGVACEIVAPRAADPAAMARAVLGDAPVDVALVPAARRRKKLLIADMDSTMIEQECIDELADAVGIKAEIASITERAMRGELDFEAALKTRVALLKGLDRKAIEVVRREKITLTPGGRALVQTMKAYGAYTALISGGFTFFADFFAKRIGFDEATANTLEFEGESLTGTVSSPIVDKSIKLKRLQSLANERGIALEETLAVGDGANDLDMIRASGLGVAFRAKPAVAAAAHARIEHGDLTALLYLQGYADDEIVR